MGTAPHDCPVARVLDNDGDGSGDGQSGLVGHGDAAQGPSEGSGGPAGKNKERGEEAAAGEVAMAQVFDQLYDGYGNGVDTKSGPDQRRIFREGLGPMLRDFPKMDVLHSCSLLAALI